MAEKEVIVYGIQWIAEALIKVRQNCDHAGICSIESSQIFNGEEFYNRIWISMN